jgi:hypothetical protein
MILFSNGSNSTYSSNHNFKTANTPNDSILHFYTFIANRQGIGRCTLLPYNPLSAPVTSYYFVNGIEL